MEYDFYKHGLRVASEEREKLYDIANAIKKEYGEEAYNEFMMGAKGVSETMDPYENTPERELEDIFNNTTRDKIIEKAEDIHQRSK